MKRNLLLIMSAAILIVAALGGSGCTKTERDLFCTLYGVISDVESGDPISGAAVTLSPGGKSQLTGSTGAFEFKDLDPAQYTITVQKSGYATNRKTITAVIGEDTEANIPLTKSN